MRCVLHRSSIIQQSVFVYAFVRFVIDLIPFRAVYVTLRLCAGGGGVVDVVGVFFFLAGIGAISLSGSCSVLADEWPTSQNWGEIEMVILYQPDFNGGSGGRILLLCKHGRKNSVCPAGRTGALVRPNSGGGVIRGEVISHKHDSRNSRYESVRLMEL